MKRIFTLLAILIFVHCNLFAQSDMSNHILLKDGTKMNVDNDWINNRSKHWNTQKFLKIGDEKYQISQIASATLAGVYYINYNNAILVPRIMEGRISRYQYTIERITTSSNGTKTSTQIVDLIQKDGGPLKKMTKASLTSMVRDNKKVLAMINKYYKKQKNAKLIAIGSTVPIGVGFFLFVSNLSKSKDEPGNKGMQALGIGTAVAGFGTLTYGMIKNRIAYFQDLETALNLYNSTTKK